MAIYTKLDKGKISIDSYNSALPAIEEIINKKIPELNELRAKVEMYKDLIGSVDTVMTKEQQEIHLGRFSSGVHAFITAFSHENINGEWGGWGREGDVNFVTSLTAGNQLLADA